eukprot:300891-Chlamydomonas_euryale.AAC.10
MPDPTPPLSPNPPFVPACPRRLAPAVQVRCPIQSSVFDGTSGGEGAQTGDGAEAAAGGRSVEV